jgi:hypothetical protein
MALAQAEFRDRLGSNVISGLRMNQKVLMLGEQEKSHDSRNSYDNPDRPSR